MPGYLTAETIKGLREGRGLTQRALADAVGVTDKAVSKWESGRGLPDISLVEPLAAALGVSVAELLTGDIRQNANRAGNLMRARFYVCPVCGNVVYALGEGSFSCCGVHLVPCEAEEPDEEATPSEASGKNRKEETAAGLSLQDGHVLQNRMTGEPVIAAELPEPDTVLPESFDLREEGVLTPVQDQAATNTCWSFGSTAAVESSYLINGSNLYDFNYSSKSFSFW